MATKKTVSRSKACKKPPTSHQKRIAASMAVIDAATSEPEGRPYLALPRVEVESVLRQLKELTHTAVDAWACKGDMADGLEDVLVALHAARMNLESEMNAALARAGGAK